MEETNVQNTAPVSEETVAQETPTEVPSQPVEETQVETPVETTESTTQTQETVSEPEVALPEYDITQFMQQSTTPEFSTDDNGYIDPKEFYAQVMRDAEARMEQKLRFQESERKLWAQVENKYPEIKEDAELREILNAQRIADVASGGKGDLNKIADKLLDKFQSYQNRGKAQAQVSEKVQKSASLESTTNNNVSTDKDGDLMDRMSRGDKNARDQLISEWLSSGKI